jgi:hydroxymethylpyrimidine pyrophosphatase-like HAD family hydrolase
MKQDLINTLKNPAGKLILVDFDDTITKNGEPWKRMIDAVNSWYKKGAHIIIYTARDSSRYAETESWLLAHGVCYNGINMNKPHASVYVDDCALNVEDVP